MNGSHKKAVSMFLKFECNELAYYLYILFIIFPKMKLFISAPNQILNTSNILDKIRLTKERAPIYPKPFSGGQLFGKLLLKINVILTNDVLILQDLNCLKIQVKLFITFLYISKFILGGISSRSKNLIKSDDNRIPCS